MEPQPDQSPLIAIVGPTASGKSSVALELAQACNGEIIAADSRTVYRGMDIGTAKPSRQDRELVRHHLIDILDPDQRFTAADFKQRALAAIEDISSRGKLPILVGGTGLYIDAVVFDFSFAAPPNLEERQRLQALSIVELQTELRARGIPLPANDRNPRHLVRQLEMGGATAQDRELRGHTLILGTQLDKVDLDVRIRHRVQAMLTAGLETEVRRLVDAYGWQCAVLQTIGYQEWRPYFDGDATVQEVGEAIVRNTIQYAKRQRTWFKRNKSVHWLNKEEKFVDLVTTFLNK
jgi:tRNA dimethylallyltransferase